MKIVQVKEIATQIRGVSYSKGDAISNKIEGYLPLIRANNIVDGVLTNDDLLYVSGSIVQEKQIIKAGDIVIAASSGSINIVGKAAYSPENLYSTFGAFCKLIRPNTKHVLPAYLNFYFQSNAYRTKISSLAQGANINNLKNEHIDELEILLPPLPEQKRIAEILDKADVLRQKNKQLLSAYDELLQATFLDMFGDPVTNPKEFRNIEFNEIISQGPTNGIYKPQSEYGEGNFILRIDTYNNGDLTYIDNLKRVKASVKELETYSLKKHDILINRVNSPSHLGKSTLVIGISEEAIFESNMMRIRIDHAVANPIFIIKVLSQPYLKGQILTRAKDAVNQSSINQEDVKGFTFYLPPISLQNQFAQIVENIEAQKTLVKQSFQESEDLFNGLVQKAFGGEL